LLKPYFGKVKMIYIDPPYNTGKDFIYRDNFKQPLKELFRKNRTELTAKGKNSLPIQKQVEDITLTGSISCIQDYF